MRVRRACFFILAFIAVTLSVSVPMLSEQDDAAITPDAGLIEKYPDADFIIYDSGRSGMVMIERKAHVPTASEIANPSLERPDYDWTARSVSTGSSNTLRGLSDVDGSMNVVMVSGRLGMLTLIQADTLSSDPVDVSFLMVGGTLDSLRVLSVPPSLKGKLQTSYTLIDRLLGDITLDFGSGSVTEVCPTEDMVGGSSIRITVSEGMSVDRLFPSGKNGRYDDVRVILDGGSVGYMTNIQAMVGSLRYDFFSGSVDYFCIGADTEYGNNSSISGLNTFYARKDVEVHIDSTVSFRSVIIGSGIVEFPHVLWNGVAVSSNTIDNMAKNILIDANGTTVNLGKCFTTSNKFSSGVYQLSSYTIGGGSRTKSLSTTYYDSNYRYKPLYGSEGVWDSVSDLTIPTGFVLIADCTLIVSQDVTFTVSAGSKLTMAGSMMLEGQVVNDGQILNTGVIEKSRGGNISGNSPSGDGFVAYCITVNPHDDGTVDVMASEDDAVVIRTDGTSRIRSISVLLMNGNREVSLKIPESVRFTGERFLIALRSVDSGDWEASYDFYVDGIDPNVLSKTHITITVPSPGYADYVAYHQDDYGDLEKMESVDSTHLEVSFVANGLGRYNLSMDDNPNNKSDMDSGRMLNYLLAAAIAATGSATIYILLKKD